MFLGRIFKQNWRATTRIFGLRAARYTLGSMKHVCSPVSLQPPCFHSRHFRRDGCSIPCSCRAKHQLTPSLAATCIADTPTMEWIQPPSFLHQTWFRLELSDRPSFYIICASPCLLPHSIPRSQHHTTQCFSLRLKLSHRAHHNHLLPKTWWLGQESRSYRLVRMGNKSLAR